MLGFDVEPADPALYRNCASIAQGGDELLAVERIAAGPLVDKARERWRESIRPQPPLRDLCHGLGRQLTKVDLKRFRVFRQRLGRGRGSRRTTARDHKQFRRAPQDALEEAHRGFIKPVKVFEYDSSWSSGRAQQPDEERLNTRGPSRTGNLCRERGLAQGDRRNVTQQRRPGDQLKITVKLGGQNFLLRLSADARIGIDHRGQYLTPGKIWRRSIDRGGVASRHENTAVL